MRPTLALCSIGLVSAMLSTTALGGSDSQDVIIDFDDLLGGLPPVETDGLFSELATFSTNDNNILMIFAGAGFVGGSGPNTLAAGISTTADNYNGNIYVDFTYESNNLTLDILSDNDSGNVAMLNIHHAGGLSFMDVVGNGDFTDPIAMDLTMFTDVTRIELVGINDEFGLTMDNLSFSVPVPAPSTLALLGLGGLFASNRRR